MILIIGPIILFDFYYLELLTEDYTIRSILILIIKLVAASNIILLPGYYSYIVEVYKGNTFKGYLSCICGKNYSNKEQKENRDKLNVN